MHPVLLPAPPRSGPNRPKEHHTDEQVDDPLTAAGDECLLNGAFVETLLQRERTKRLAAGPACDEVSPAALEVGLHPGEVRLEDFGDAVGEQHHQAVCSSVLDGVLMMLEQFTVAGQRSEELVGGRAGLFRCVERPLNRLRQPDRVGAGTEEPGRDDEGVRPDLLIGSRGQR